jgi:protein-L-isoaspartate(D-aspartate) O-methyltransferase
MPQGFVCLPFAGPCRKRNRSAEGGKLKDLRAEFVDMDFATARRMMVDGQVRTSDVTNLDLIDAMLDVARERFVPAAKADIAYLDRDVAVGGEAQSPRRLLKPMVLAKLIQAADVRSGNTVLDVACATGYSSAILSRLAGSVVALESDADLARKAERILSQVGAANITVVQGPFADGWPAGAPYDVILINGMSEILPKELCRQLKHGGRLVGVFGEGVVGKAMVYLSEAGEVSGRAIFDAAAPLLPVFAKPPAFVF